MLAPIWALFVLVAGASIAYRLAVVPILALPAGAGLTALAVLRARRGRRLLVAAFGVAGSLWALLALAFGLGRITAGLLLAIWLSAAVLWWRWTRIRSRIVVREYPVHWPAVGEWWQSRDLVATSRAFRELWLPAAQLWWSEQRYRRQARRRLTAISGDWRRTASAAEVPGCRIRLAEGDRVAYTLHVDLRRGQTHDRMLRHASMLGSALSADLGTLRIEPERRMDRVRIRWVHEDPLAGPAIPWPHVRTPEVGSAKEPFTLGPNEIGELIQVRLADGVHTLVVGETDAGKSSLLHVIVAGAAGMRDVVLWGIDPAEEVEFGLWGPVWDRLARDFESAAALVTALERVMQARLRLLRRARRAGGGVGLRNWEARLGPYILVVIDELAQLPESLRRRLGQIVQLCRKCGIRLVVATQHPSVETVGTDLRSQLDRVICLHLKSERAIQMAFDWSGAKAAGWDPTVLVERGSFLIRSRHHREPVPARAYWLDDDTVEAIAGRLGTARPALDPESARAADGEPDAARATAAESGDEGARPMFAGQLVGRRSLTPRGRDQLMDKRLPVLLAALRHAGRPVSARGVAELTGLPHGWVGERGLPEAERRGAARRDDEGWVLVEPELRVEEGA